MNKALKKTALQGSLSASALDNKTPKNEEYNYKIVKRKKEMKLKVEFKKEITKDQQVKTLMAVYKSILNYLTLSGPLVIHSINFSSKIADLKNEDFAVVTANSTLGYASTSLVPPPPPGGGPHKEIRAGVPHTFQKNIKDLTTISYAEFQI